MRILQVYNQQRSVFGGEETVIKNTTAVLTRRGHEVMTAVRSSREIDSSLFRKMSAAINGIYSISAASEMERLIQRERPDVVHAHGIYPMWSPSIFSTCRRMGVPTILHVHCHYLTCPNWYHLRNNKVCEQCLGGKEYRCLVNNCRGSLAESAAYFVRAYVARATGLVTNNVTTFVAVSHFIKSQLVKAGFEASQIEVLPNVVLSARDRGDSPTRGDYVGYCGRLSPEKGVNIVLEAARRTGLPLVIAGDGPERRELEKLAPQNVSFLGHCGPKEVEAFYNNCRFLVLPSLSFEGFPMAAVEAMMHGRCVIGSRIGAIPEVIQDGRNGLLFEPGDSSRLAELMSSLWGDDARCRTYGDAARESVQSACSEGAFYNKLVSIYQSAIQNAPLKRGPLGLTHLESSFPQS